MNYRRLRSGVFATAVVVVLTTTAVGRTINPAFALPEFPSSSSEDWFNSAPLTVAMLRGKVVLLDFWTFDCWNCYRSFPWLNGLEEKLANEPFLIIGIHSPEFEHEHLRGNLVAKIAEFQLRHPIMRDNDFRYWSALDNRFWPAFYLIDKQGRVRHLHVGETHDGDLRAQQIESEIRALLAE